MDTTNGEDLQLAFPTQPLPSDTHDGAERAAANADDWWRSCAEQAIGQLASTGRPFTADDVRRLGVPEPDVANRWGGVFRRAYKAGLIAPTGVARPSTTTSRRGGLLKEWHGVLEREGAA